MWEKYCEGVLERTIKHRSRNAAAPNPLLPTCASYTHTGTMMNAPFQWLHASLNRTHFTRLVARLSHLFQASKENLLASFGRFLITSFGIIKPKKKSATRNVAYHRLPSTYSPVFYFPESNGKKKKAWESESFCPGSHFFFLYFFFCSFLRKNELSMEKLYAALWAAQ